MEIALQKPELSARQLAWHITDNEGYFISERSVYRIVKNFDLLTSPAYIVMSAADEFQHKTKEVHELWQTDFTYFKITGWGWYYLSTVLNDYSRYIVIWKRTRSTSCLRYSGGSVAFVQPEGKCRETGKKPKKCPGRAAIWATAAWTEPSKDVEIRGLSGVPVSQDTPNHVSR